MTFVCGQTTLCWFSVIFSSIDATPICLHIQSFHILYFTVWSHIYLNILFLLFSLLSCLYKVQRSLPQSIARCITVWKNFPLNLVSILRPQTTSDTFILSNHPACIRLNTGKHCTAFPVSLFNKIQNSCKWNMLINSNKERWEEMIRHVSLACNLKSYCSQVWTCSLTRHSDYTCQYYSVIWCKQDMWE